ncbi:MAG TPA: hypothetical protein VFC74_08845 [Oscillospiraceae bacterium]|nr:hypothetical protein [Oscillospiraceae bacterium]
MKKALLFSFFCLLLLTNPAQAAAAGKVVIVSLSRTSTQQLADDENMATWLAQSAVGLLNTGTASNAVSRHLYVTMGAGSRALGNDSTRLAFLQEEEYNGTPAQIIFTRHQGSTASGRIVHVGMADLIYANQTLNYPVQPGLLGDALHAGGKKTAVIGNADASQVNREAAAILADSKGEIDFGQVGTAILLDDAAFPYGLRLHKEQVWQIFRELYAKTDVILIDWGDTARLDMYRTQLRQQVAKQLEEEIFRDIDWLLERLTAVLHRDDLLLLLAAVPPNGAAAAETLGLVAVRGGSFLPGRLVTSATTQRAGLAAVTDLAPLVLTQLGLALPQAMIGRPLQLAGSGNVQDLLAMQSTIDRIYRLRSPLLRVYVICQIIFVLGALLNLFLRLIPAKYFESALLGLLSFPLLLLYLPLAQLSLSLSFIVCTAAVVIVVLLLQKLLAGPIERFALIACATSLSLLIDIFRDAQLMQISVLGYDPVSGARYYGLGNEYMGIWVGTTVLGVTALTTLAPRWRKWLLGLSTILFAGIALLMVAPNGGANFGGTLTAIAAFITTLAVLFNFRFSWKSASITVVSLVAVAILAILINIYVPQNLQSHLGRTLVLLQQQGWQALKDIIIRKGSMNLKLFRYSQWSRVLLAFLGVLAVLFYRPQGILVDIHKMYPDLAAGFLGIIAGSVTALLVNDSGVVAAATTLLYAGVPLIILASRVARETPRPIINI